VRIPGEVTPLLAKLPEGLTHLLGANLVGVYVYGSVLDATFDPAGSDIDCIAVTERALTDIECRQLNYWLTEAGAADPWVRRLQVSFLIKNTVLADDSRACLFQFGELKRSGSDGNPIIWMDFFERGCTLSGAAPESFLPRITTEIFRRALFREVGYLREELSVKPDSQRREDLSYRVYAVLTLCRILYSVRTGKVVSKARAGRWALDHVPPDWHDLIHQALENGESGWLEALPVQRLCAFVEYTLAQVDSTPPVTPSIGAVSSLERPCS
jgi:hypothetical protein